MPVKRFRIITIVTGLVLAGTMAWCIVANQPIWIALAATGAAIIIKVVARRKVTEPFTDERVTTISNRATAITYRVFLFMIAITSFIIVLLGDLVPDEIRIIGTTLAFAAGAMMILYLSCYYFLAARS